MVRGVIKRVFDNAAGGIARKSDNLTPDDVLKNVGDESSSSGGGVGGAVNKTTNNSLVGLGDNNNNSFSALGAKVDEILLPAGNKNTINIKRVDELIPNNKRLQKKINSPDDLAKKVGFKNEDDLFQYIKQNNVGKTGKLKTLFNIMRKNKKVVARLGLGASAITLYHYCVIYQQENSGCFRYRKNRNGECIKSTRKKIEGHACWPINNSKGVEIKSRKHPLSSVEKWGCKDSIEDFKEANEKDILVKNEILKLGCAGLCNVENFNTLAAMTDNRYKPVDKNDGRYIYKCERVSILKFLFDSAGDAIDDIVEGAINSDLGNRLVSIFDFTQIRFYIIIFIILFFYYHFFCKNNLKNIDHVID